MSGFFHFRTAWNKEADFVSECPVAGIVAGVAERDDVLCGGFFVCVWDGEDSLGYGFLSVAFPFSANGR